MAGFDEIPRRANHGKNIVINSLARARFVDNCLRIWNDIPSPTEEAKGIRTVGSESWKCCDIKRTCQTS
jgi:pentatricopeptide repeat protein